MTSDTILMLVTVLIAISGFYNGFIYSVAQLVCCSLVGTSNILILYYKKNLFAQNNIQTNILLLTLMSFIWIPLFWTIIRMCLPKQLPIGILFTNRVLGLFCSVSTFFCILIYIDMSMPSVNEKFLHDSLIMQDARKYRPYIKQCETRVQQTQLYKDIIQTLKLNK